MKLAVIRIFTTSKFRFVSRYMWPLMFVVLVELTGGSSSFISGSSVVVIDSCCHLGGALLLTGQTFDPLSDILFPWPLMMRPFWLRLQPDHGILLALLAVMHQSPVTLVSPCDNKLLLLQYMHCFYSCFPRMLRCGLTLFERLSEASKIWSCLVSCVSLTWERCQSRGFLEYSYNYQYLEHW